MTELKEITKFAQHLWESIEGKGGLIDSLNDDYDEKYDLLLTINGKTLRLPMNADLYDNFTMFIRAQIKIIADEY